MAYSKINIEFYGIPSVDQVLHIVEESLGLNLTETFKTFRDAPNETLIPLFFPDDGTLPDRYKGYSSTNYKNALNLDINSSNLFTITWDEGLEDMGLGTVVITANYENAVFSVVTNSAPADISITNENPDPIDPPDPIFSFSPAFFNFVHRQNDPRPFQNITMTGNSWKIVAKPNFVLSSSTSGVSITSVTGASGTYLIASGSGNATVGVALDVYYDSDVAFIPSDLTGTFDILKNDVAFGMINFTVSVAQLSTFLKNPFSPGNLYFTKALDFLKFTSSTMGTYIYFDIEIKVFKLDTYEPIIYNRNYKLPLFQGKEEFHIGTIVHDLLEEINDLTEFVPTYKTNYHKTQYRPAEITISFEEKTFGATVPNLISADLPMFKMAKGYKPFMTDGQLALLTVSQQEITRITPQSFIGTSFVYFGTPRIVVKKNNLIIDDFEIEPVDNQVIYSYFRFINNLKPGDSIEIIIINGLETRSQRHLVFQNGLESTYFFFENDNGLVEPYEFSGRRRVSTPLKHITTPKFKNLQAYKQKVKTEIEQTMTVNTGQLTKTDHRIITSICKSLNVWCSFDNPSGPYFKVDSTTSKITNQDTSTNEEGFDIDFNLLENADASIYPL
jgi:hypothetical protein